MPKTLTTGQEMVSYLKTFDSYLKNEFELLGFVVADLMRNGIPVSDRSIISCLTYKLETETNEATLLSYRKILALLLTNQALK